MIRPWHTREELAHQVVTLAKQGQTRRAIARALGISRNTVRALLEAHAAARETEHIAIPQAPSRAPRPSKLDAFKPRVAALLSRFKDITAQRVFEILKDEEIRRRLYRCKSLPAQGAPPTTADAEPGDARLRTRRDVRERLVPVRDTLYDG
jgi:transposase